MEKNLNILNSEPEFVAPGSVAIWLTESNGNVMVNAKTENSECIVLAKITRRGTVEAKSAYFAEEAKT